MSLYYRPLLQNGTVRPSSARRFGESGLWFADVEVLSRTAAPKIIPASEMPDEWTERITRPRPPIAGVSMAAPVIMGIVNVTPDSFSDGGQNAAPDQAARTARAMQTDGAQILDIGGESTRPGAETVPPETEIARVAPAIEAIRAAGVETLISVDTRKAAVAEAALDAGAGVVNDVAGFTYDAGLAPLCADRAVPVCVMHAQGDPATMHLDPRYDDVLLDVYDFLDQRIAALTAQGIPRAKIIADPGIGFGKTLAHNLLLLNRISLFHGLGVPILLGVSRKRFIGTIGNAPQAGHRMPGSIAVALAALAQGVQILRVHDVTETAQAVALWSAVQSGEFDE